MSRQIKIVLATDFSEAADNAIEFAYELFTGREELEVSFILAHGFKPMVPYTNPPTPSIPVMMNEELEKELRARIERKAEVLKKNASVTTYFERGALSEALRLVIEKKNPDLIVMGSREKTTFERMTIGSNTLEVAMNINCPVLAVPREAKYKELRNIVLATDFEPFDISGKSLDMLRMLLKVMSTSLTLLHVYKPGDKEEPPALHRQLSDLVYQFQPVTNKNVAEGIVQYTEDVKPELLAVVPRDRSFFEGIFHTSITEKMVYHAHIPILILR